MMSEEAVNALRARAEGRKSVGDVGGLITMLKDDHWKARQEACFALGAMGPDAVDPLLAVAGDVELDEYARGHAMLALREIGDPRAFGPLLLALADEAWQVRGYAARALGVFRHAAAIEPLIATYRRDETEHCSVRNWVASSLHEIGDPAALDFLREIAENDVDGGVKATARRAVEDIEAG